MIPISPLKVGPFTVERTLMTDGWTRHSLVVEGTRVRSWISVPSINDCRDALLVAQARDSATRKTVDLLLRSADSAANEAAEIDAAAQPGGQKYQHFLPPLNYDLPAWKARKRSA